MDGCMVPTVRHVRVACAAQLPRVVSWGAYQEERPFLDEMQRRASDDFKFMKKWTIEQLKSVEKIEKVSMLRACAEGLNACHDAQT